MKNLSKNNYSGKNRKQHKNNSDSNFYSNNTNLSKKIIDFLLILLKIKGVTILMKVIIRKLTFHIQKEQRQ